jgi:uncharacterized lipoprotein YddW (UPF0748 family)
MTARIKIMSAFIGLMPAMLFAADLTYVPVAATPPAPQREFRGAWLATVANLDWPSKPGLSVAEQKAELITLLDHAVQLKLNAIIFQVRPMADAMYASPLEPWSEFLTGTMGRSPQPFYDPLAFAIAEAHQRGLELHAWFNPFRVSLPPAQARSPAALEHLSRTHPELVRRYGNLLWLDPGEPAAREHVLNVVLDVVRRYDVDGVTFDDYFYPDPQGDAAGRKLDFPDYASWKKYGEPRGLSRDDWRRQNINEFIQNVYHSIKATKPQVQFGVSPKGIWRPGNPPAIKGLDAYEEIYADSRLWLANGWLDYFSPQLYWAVDAKAQSFPVLLHWWEEQNQKHRHLWPVLDDTHVGQQWKPDEIARQIEIARGQAGVTGEIHYDLRSLMKNSALAGAVCAPYASAALVPTTPWLDSIPPEKPRLTVMIENPGTRAHWEVSGGEPAWLWVLQFRSHEVWTTEILPANQTSRTFHDSQPDVIAVSAVDRVGNESEPAALKKITLPSVRQSRNGNGLNWRSN